MTVETVSYLTPEQRAYFLEHGWVRIPQAVPKEHIELYTKDIWIRLGYDKDDPSTWDEERFRMPRHREMPWPEFAPKANGAICACNISSQLLSTFNTNFYCFRRRDRRRS
jgi:hypothetical protein